MNTDINDGQKRLLQDVVNEDLDKIHRLVDDGVDMEAKDASGLTPLSMAALRGYLTIVKFLVGRGADMETRDGHGWTPLSLAAYSGNLDVVKFLVNHGADMKTKINGGPTPLSLAKITRHVEIAGFLEENIARRLVAADIGNLTKSAAHR